MKNLLILICVFLISFSCTKDNTTVEVSPKKAEGTLINDSVIKSETLQFKTGPKVPKEDYIVSRRPFSLDAVYGKETMSSITPKDGLPPSQFRNLLKDSKGNIWINDFAFQVLKYDGQNFKNYQSPGSEWYTFDIRLGHNDEVWTLQIKPASDGIEWKTVVYNGISFWEPKELKAKSKGSAFLVMQIFEGIDGSIWHINIDDQIISKYKGRELLEQYSSEDFNFEIIRTLQDFGDEGTLFFDSRKAKLVKLLHEEFEEVPLQNLIPGARVFNVNPLSPNSYYVSTDKGLYFIKDGQAKLINEEDSDIEVVDSDRMLWVESEEELFKINDSLSLRVLPKSELSKLGRFTISKDDQNDVWLTGQSFLGKFDNTLKIYPDVLNGAFDGLNSNLINILYANNGDYFIGTSKSGLLHYDGTSLINYSFQNQSAENTFNKNYIFSLREDDKGTIWFVQLDDKNPLLTKFDGEYFQSYVMGEGRIEIEHIDSKGRLWLSQAAGNGRNSNLLMFDGDSLQKITSTRLLGQLSLLCVYEDQSGNIWIGSLQGLYQYADQQIRKYTVNDGLPNNFINALSEDRDGNLWIGTDGGLSIFSNNSFVNYGKADGLIDLKISDIVRDDYNKKFWLKNRGSERLTVVGQDPIDPKTLLVENYSSAEGFPIPSGFGFTVDDQGVAWVETDDNALFRFDYPALKEKSKAFPLKLNNIRLNGESVVWSQLHDNYAKDSVIARTEMSSRFGLQKTAQELDRLRKTFSSVSYDSLTPFEYVPVGLQLPYAANSVSFEFNAIDPFLAKSTKYQYFLEGFDKAWSPLDKNNIANYGNLMEGDYTLKIKALNPYGQWSETAYKFNVLPPWYRTWWAYVIYGLIALFLFWQLHHYQKKRTIKREREKTRERELKQAKEIEKAYNELKTTQAQLIQSEKMASLGELTAGIAHEIQNPLNFVNNFSELNKELIGELKEEIDKGDLDEARQIADDIEGNEEKINHHGQRADRIVKGMLQHSRSGGHQKEPTDINALADEYLRLAYHGLRAKDKSFNAEIHTDFDNSIKTINVVPQDIGRVILNLVTNAFYAVQQKKQANPTGYDPEVSISTKRKADTIEIKVKDNGNGIPETVKDKIFQPFFTTKPTGEGTGLGLSLSYDIITKGHGGDLTVETQEGEGTTICIILPIN